MVDPGNSLTSSSYAYTTDIWPALITFAIVVYLGVYGWRRREIPAARPFVIACLLGSIWVLGVILELATADFSTRVLWVKFQGIWRLPLASTITCFILRYAGLGRWLNRRTYALLFFIPGLSVLVMATNGLHHLMWAGFTMDRYVVVLPGKLFWFFESHIYILGVVNIAVLIWLALKSPGHRLPVVVIVSCQVIARTVLAVDRLEPGLIGPGESVLLTIGLMAVAYSVAILRFHAIDPVAAARETALQQMREGFIVLDLEGRIAAANPMAAAMLGVPESSIRNARLEDVLPVDVGDLWRAEEESAGQREITIETSQSTRRYRLEVTALRGRYREIVGRLVLVQDVTEQKRAQDRILDQQRMVATLQERERLARELHDGIGQTLGYVGMQAQSALKWLHDGDSEKAGSQLERLVDVARDAHTDIRESILSLRAGSGQQWAFLPALEEYVRKFQANHGMHTELSLSAGVDEHTFDPAAGAHVLRVIQEAMTNARKHSQASSLRVRMERNGSKALVSIADDGQGFDADQLERGDNGHFGLVFMRERMAQIGGSLEIESVPGGGTVLTLHVPIGDDRRETR